MNGWCRGGGGIFCRRVRVAWDGRTDHCHTTTCALTHSHRLQCLNSSNVQILKWATIFKFSGKFIIRQNVLCTTIQYVQLIMNDGREGGAPANKKGHPPSSASASVHPQQMYAVVGGDATKYCSGAQMTERRIKPKEVTKVFYIQANPLLMSHCTER